MAEHDYGVEGARILATRFVREHLNEFSEWLIERNVDPADCVAWIERQEALSRLAPALRGSGGSMGLQEWK